MVLFAELNLNPLTLIQSLTSTFYLLLLENICLLSLHPELIDYIYSDKRGILKTLQSH